MVTTNTSNDKDKVLGNKPIDKKVVSDSVEWIFDMLGWKKNARRDASILRDMECRV